MSTLEGKTSMTLSRIQALKDVGFEWEALYPNNSTGGFPQ
jgi:hypothetical protein